MRDGCDEIACTCFTLGSNHGGTFVNTTNGFTEFGSTTHEWNFVGFLVDVEERISRCENFGLIDHVYAHGFENPCFAFVADTCLGHNWNGCAVKNALNHVRMACSSNTACLANVRWNSLECHNCNSPSIFCDSCLFCINNVHDDATLLHSGKATLDEVASVTKLGKVSTRHEYQSLRRFTPSRRLVKHRD